MRMVISCTKVISWIYFILSSLLAIKLGWIKKKFVKLMLFSFHQISKDGWRKCIWLGNFKSYFTSLKKPWILVGITCCSLLKTSLFIFQFIIFVNIKWGLISNLMPYYKNLLHSVQKWNLMRFDFDFILPGKIRSRNKILCACFIPFSLNRFKCRFFTILPSLFKCIAWVFHHVLH